MRTKVFCSLLIFVLVLILLPQFAVAKKVALNPSNQTWHLVCGGGNEAQYAELSAIQAETKLTALGHQPKIFYITGDFSAVVNAVNLWGAEAFVSMHTNALQGGCSGTASGTMTVYNKDDTTQDDFALGDKVRAGLVNSLGLQDRGKYLWINYNINPPAPGNLGILSNVIAPNTLEEALYHDNTGDSAILRSSAGQEKIASGVANGINAYFGGGQKSDLTIVEPVVVSPASVTPGGTIQVDWTEKNKGTVASSPAHNTKIFLSTSAYGTTYQVGYYGPMNTLGVGATLSYTAANTVVTASIPPGDYYVTVYIDSDSQVSEENDNNNIGSSSPNRVTIAATTGTLSVTTTPVSGGIFVDSVAKGTGTWSGSVSTGSHTVSFGAVSGYNTPAAQTKTINAGETTNITGTYTLIQTTGTLSVTPTTNFSSSGTQGGPFSPSSTSYTLQNTGGASINCTVSKGQSWVTLSPTGITLAAGASITVTVSINSAANSLTSGSYSDTVSFTNTTNGNGNTTRSVSLTVNPTGGGLSVTPSTGLTSSGTQGGPFSPSSTSYTLQNTGGASINCTVSKGQSWVTLSPTGITLAAGASITVTVSINSAANSLTSGSYSDTVSFTNTTNGNGNTTRSVSLTVNPTGGGLSVTPSTGLTSSGTQGGPFSPSSTSYTLQNTGGASINCTVSKGQSWVTLSPTGITLAAGASITVTVSINSAANSLTSGSYSDTVSFTNTTNGNGNQTRSVNLTVNASCTPSSIQVTINNPSSGFSVTHGSATTVNATVKDNCGNNRAGAGVSVSFSNGDASITLYDDGAHNDGPSNDGVYANTWTPNNVGSCAITVTASKAGLSTGNGIVSGTIQQQGSSNFKLPDSGQTQCYNSSGIEVNCAGTGQDGAYDINPMSYTDNLDGTVTDNNTGLMWEQQDDGNTYNWYETSGTYDASYNPTSQDICGALTTGSYTDWRLPSKKELMSIVDYSIPNPGSKINTTYFPNTNASNYWSSTTGAYNPNNAWYVDFNDGRVDSSYKTYGMYVRCVRGGK